MAPSEQFRTDLVPPARVVWPRTHAGLAPVPPSLTLGPEPPDAARPAYCGPTVLLDFGRELFGGVRFRVGAAAPGTRLRLRLGESATEAITGSFVDRTLDAPPGAAVDVGPTGFRFLRLDLLDPA